MPSKKSKVNLKIHTYIKNRDQKWDRDSSNNDLKPEFSEQENNSICKQISHPATLVKGVITWHHRAVWVAAAYVKLAIPCSVLQPSMAFALQPLPWTFPVLSHISYLTHSHFTELFTKRTPVPRGLGNKYRPPGFLWLLSNGQNGAQKVESWGR